MSDKPEGQGGHGHGHGQGHGGDEIPRVDVNERGGKGPDGQPLVMNKRLFVQLLVAECPDEARPEAVLDELEKALAARKVASVIYEDATDPRGFGILTYDEDPAVFVEGVRPALNSVGPKPLRFRHDFAMMGRSYASGHETDLQFWLIDRPKSVVENPAWNWHVWYPLRRSGAFAKLDGREQAAILREHAIIGRAYGAQDLAHDVRLACHGLDANDNEFVVGLIGDQLHPLSHVVQSMRKTRQTSEYIVQMGPFFVGHAVRRTKKA
jgi:chlorite dismutase